MRRTLPDFTEQGHDLKARFKRQQRVNDHPDSAARSGSLNEPVRGSSTPVSELYFNTIFGSVTYAPSDPEFSETYLDYYLPELPRGLWHIDASAGHEFPSFAGIGTGISIHGSGPGYNALGYSRDGGAMARHQTVFTSWGPDSDFANKPRIRTTVYQYDIPGLETATSRIISWSITYIGPLGTSTFP